MVQYTVARDNSVVSGISTMPRLLSMIRYNRQSVLPGESQSRAQPNTANRSPSAGQRCCIPLLPIHFSNRDEARRLVRNRNHCGKRHAPIIHPRPLRPVPIFFLPVFRGRHRSNRTRELAHTLTSFLQPPVTGRQRLTHVIELPLAGNPTTVGEALRERPLI